MHYDLIVGQHDVQFINRYQKSDIYIYIRKNLMSICGKKSWDSVVNL